ncbi:MAG: hypothetical protein RLZZ15_3894 [Verrucomicrobiota bacterium]|jgi:hypothetical protein
MPFAELDPSALFTEEFLVKVGATTGTLAAFAILASFWLVKQVVAGEANAAKVALVKSFMLLCTGALVVSATATGFLAFNNRGKKAEAETRAVAAVSREREAATHAEQARTEAESSSRLAQAAVAEKQNLLADVSALRRTIADTESANTRLVAALNAMRAEPTLAVAAKSKLDGEIQAVARSAPVSAPKATTQFEQLLKKHAAGETAPAPMKSPAPLKLPARPPAKP